ncbi:MAG: ribosomal protein S18-alanine N-acetyltransferase [Methanobrevibacter sp.]|jgi:ribosomal-protein-alanine N-acetyltransferase|nr:ribosomal protein S18-alanine N-acetyltransferase [Candidatus Methanovirga basalitermitum]
MIIREFQTIDLIRVYEIEKEAFSNPYEKNILQFLYNIGSGFLVAEDEKLILGYIIFSLKEENQGNIVSIAVAKKFRSQNIGSALLQTAITLLKAFNTETIYLEVKSSKQGAINFYKKFGFKKKKVLKSCYEDGSDGISMHLRLKR